jgi:molybdate transport system regulatory protein
MVDGPKIEAVLALKGGGRSPVGRERIALLRAVAEHGSITKAAQAVGLSYKAAWDALNAINNLMARPAVTAQTGGRHGGGAVVTEEGRALIEAFGLLEDRLARAAALLAEAGGDHPFDPLALIGSLGMKTSARNALRCIVADIREGGVTAELILRATERVTLAALITKDSVRELGIVPGLPVTALIKASSVLLAPGEDPPRVSARNRIHGRVMRRDDGPVSSEVTLNIGDGKTLTATLTKDGAEDLGLQPGCVAWALFKASHVIIAVD